MNAWFSRLPFRFFSTANRHPVKRVPKLRLDVEALEDRLVPVAPFFGTATNYPIGPGGPFPQPQLAAVAVGDLTHDGHLDVVAVTQAAPQVSILQNKGDGTFNALTPITLPLAVTGAPQQPIGVVVADFNGDGKMDIAVADNFNGIVSVLLNTTPTGATTPTFANPQTVFQAQRPVALALGHFVDGDTRPDLVVVDQRTQTASVLVNNTPVNDSTLTFSTSAALDTSDPRVVAVGRFTGSAHDDIVVSAVPGVALYPGKGDGTFAAPLFGQVATVVTAVVPYADPSTSFQGFAVASEAGLVTLFPQTATIPLIQSTMFDIGTNLQGLTTGDVNGDGSTDIVAADFTTMNNAILALGPYTGSPSMPSESSYNADNDPTALIAADFNGDGAPDLAVANVGSGDVSILLNLTGTATTVMASPTNPAPNQSVTFTATVSATFASQGTPSGNVTFMDTFNGTPSSLGSASLMSGVAMLPLQGGLPAGTHQITAVYGGVHPPTGSDFSGSSSAPLSLVVSSSTLMNPTITWPAPAPINYGTPLSATQLDATANVPGTFMYTPTAGTILHAGANQTLSVTFTPTDTATYNTVTQTVSITVLQVTPILTWNVPPTVVEGTLLGAAFMNATATGIIATSPVNVTGTFAYAPPVGTVVNTVGKQILTVNFTPTDTVDYTPATMSVPIMVVSSVVDETGSLKITVLPGKKAKQLVVRVRNTSPSTIQGILTVVIAVQPAQPLPRVLHNNGFTKAHNPTGLPFFTKAVNLSPRHFTDFVLSFNRPVQVSSIKVPLVFLGTGTI
jgi:hypothetical protein